LDRFHCGSWIIFVEEVGLLGDICRTEDVTLLQVVITHVEDLAERLVPCEGTTTSTLAATPPTLLRFT
jgi:hypothetical protein